MNAEKKVGSDLKILFFSFFYFSLSFIANCQVKDNKQDCSSFDFTYKTLPSLCVSDGTIIINVSGGVGPFNYWVTGLVNTTVTSKDTITGLPGGSYTVYVEDIAPGGCGVISKTNVVVNGIYTNPNFFLTKKNVSCLKNDGSITVSSVNGGRPLFTFTIVSPSVSHVGESNTTGVFSDLVPGDYYVLLKDACGALQQRSVTVLDFDWNISGSLVTKVSCDSADAIITLQSNRGTTNSTGADFDGFLYGAISSSVDTSWFPSSHFRFFIGSQVSGTLIVKDPCGNIFSKAWNLPLNQVPTVGSITTSSYNCDSTFTASATAVMGFIQPNYCIYDASNHLIGCNTTGIFSNLKYGHYCMQISDVCNDTVLTRCFSSNPPKPAINATVSVSPLNNCSSFRVAVTGQLNLGGAIFCLTQNGPSYDTIDCNTSGVFNNIPFGNYCIKTRPNPYCFDTLITKCFTTIRPAPVVSSVQIKNDSCNTIVVDTIQGQAGAVGQYCLYDASGNQIECNTTGIFSKVKNGDYCIKAISVCGDTSEPYCFNTLFNTPIVGNNVIRTDRTCSSFTAYISDTSKLVNPVFSIYNSDNVLITQNATGIFYNLPYGSYCIHIKNAPSCYDTTFIRCFTENRPPISINATLNQSNTTCDYFTATINGTGLTNPVFYLTKANGDTITSNTTGIFTGLPYGNYCALIKDGCDTTLRICQDFEPLHGIQLSTWLTCTPNSGIVAAQLTSKNNPFNFYFYHPDGSLLYSVIGTWSGWQGATLPSLANGGQYKVLGVDACGRRDSAYIAPVTNSLIKSFSLQQLCPTGLHSNGSSNLTITSYSDPFGTVTPRIIKKDGAGINQDYSTRNLNTYIFLDMEPATYIVQYNIVSCGQIVYDTLVVPPYQFPSLTNSAIYQCDNGDFLINTSAVDGVNPYKYQIIGSLPSSSPSLNTPLQDSGFFYIHAGHSYDLVNLRAIDSCGNAALNDASILPLGNIVVTKTSNCLYQPTTLSATVIPYAVYQWYKLISTTDSTLIGSGPSFTIPYTTENDYGTYLCKLTLNSTCLTRLSYIRIEGCDGYPLPLGIQLKAKSLKSRIQLSWNKLLSGNTIYTVEHRTETGPDFSLISDPQEIITKNQTEINYTDNHPYPGINIYRIKAETQGNGILFSNIVAIDETSREEISVYPNPVRSEFTINVTNINRTNYSICLMDANQRLLYTSQLRIQGNKTLQVKRSTEWSAGVYMLCIKNQNTGAMKTFKLFIK